MSDGYTTQATGLLIAAIPLLEKLVWPVFLWLVFLRLEKRGHIETFLARHPIAEIKLLGGTTLKFVKPQSVDALPTVEKEREIVRRGVRR